MKEDEKLKDDVSRNGFGIFRGQLCNNCFLTFKISIDNAITQTGLMKLHFVRA